MYLTSYVRFAGIISYLQDTEFSPHHDKKGTVLGSTRWIVKPANSCFVDPKTGFVHELFIRFTEKIRIKRAVLSKTANKISKKMKMVKMIACNFLLRRWVIFYSNFQKSPLKSQM